jgi:four helix bundle suffix protein
LFLHADPWICANVIIGLLRVTIYLLSRQIRQLEKSFVEAVGLRERVTKARLQERGRGQFTRL